MKARIPLALALAMLLLVGMLALVSPSQAQTTVLPEPKIEILEESPDSIFVFQVSPTTAELGQSVWLLYAWGYLGYPATQNLTVTTWIPVGIDPGGCPDGCVTVMHLQRDPWGGAGISASIPATTTLSGTHVMTALFEDDLGAHVTLTATLTVQEPPTAVHLSGMSASPAAPQISWMTIALALLVVVTSLLVRRRARVRVSVHI